MSSGASAGFPYSPPSSGPEYLLLHQTVPVFKTNKKGWGIGGERGGGGGDEGVYLYDNPGVVITCQTLVFINLGKH